MKSIKWLCVSLLFAGCSAEIVEKQPAEEIVGNGKMVQAFVEQIQSADSASRTYLDEQVRMRWTEKDSITVFDMNTYNRTFMFTGKTGANAGGFTQVSVDDKYWFGYDVDYTYAVYPHSSEASLDETDLHITTEMPAVQQYAENTFGLKANTMVAVSNGSQLMFKNVGSYLRVRLYGENTVVSSVTLTTNGTESLSGEAKITPTLGGEPTCEMLGTGKSITLKCAEPVTISSDANAPTDFWLVVPPVTLANGFTVTVQNNMGNTQEIKVDKSFTFARNLYYNLTEEVEIDNNNLYIEFEDEVVESICLTSFDTNGDGQLSFDEAASVNSLSSHFRGNTYIRTFNELKYFTGLTSIIKRAFMGCSGLTSIVIPEGVTSIGDDAFQLCSGLTSIVIPEGVTSIGDDAFRDCSSLTSIVIPEGVTSIGDYAFSGCRGLTGSLIIPSSVTSIGNYAFQYCSGLTGSLIIPSSVTSIGDYAFSDCSGLTGSLTIPSSVTSIGKSAFQLCSGLTGSLTIPSSVISIGSSAFYACRSLTGSLTIPSSVTSIGDYAFSGCRGLTGNLTILGSVTSIGNAAFQLCSGLTDITIPGSVTSIGDNAFKGCSGLTSITIPSSVTSIGDNAFQNCSGLTEIKVSKENSFYDSRNGCNAIIYSLTNELLLGCSNTEIPEGVTSIGESAFFDCSGLTSVEIPSTVTSIGSSAFSRCSGLTDITIPSSVTSIGSAAFSDCSGLTDITIPSSVTSIGDNAFNRCSGLTSIVIPEGVTSIGQFAFYCCSALISVEIPSSVTSIKYCAFNGSDNIAYIYCYALKPPLLKSGIFSNNSIELHVPKGTEMIYKNSTWGTYFTNIIEMEE